MLIVQSLETMLSASLLLAAAVGSLSATPASAADTAQAGPDARIAQIATIRPQAGKEAVLAERLQALIPHTRKEPGCLRYDMLQKEDGTWMVFEYWADEAAMTAHFTAPYSAAFLKDMHDFVAGDPEMTVFKHVNVGD